MKKLELFNNLNLRDIGGYETNDNKKIKYNKIIRSDVITNYDKESINYLKNNGFTLSIDLRNKNEILNKENILNNYFEYYNITLIGDKAPKNKKDTPIIYLKMLEEYEVINKILKLIIYNKGGVIINCNLGKDRTGVIILLIMLLLDVKKDNILIDYSLSYIYLRELIREIHLNNPKMPKFLGRSDFEFIEETINLFYKKYNKIDNYLKLINISKEEIEILKINLLEN